MTKTNGEAGILRSAPAGADTTRTASNGASKSTARKKRTWLSGEVRREEILKSAIDVFASKSYQGTTVRDIAKAAGVSEALLYKYYSSKKALFLEAFERSNKVLFSEVQNMLRSSRRPSEMMRDLFFFYYRYLQRDQVYPRMLFLATAELDDPEFRRTVVGGLKKTARLLQRALKQGQDYGLISKDINVEAASWIMLGSYQMLALMKEAGILKEMDEKAFGAIIDPMFGPVTRFPTPKK